MPHDRIVNQHQPAIALYPRHLSYDLLPLVGPAGWSLLRALHDHADEQALTYRGARPIAPSCEEMQSLAGVGEASLLVIKELLRICGCLSWEEVRGKQEPRPGRRLKQFPTRGMLYYLHPLTGLDIRPSLIQRVLRYAQKSPRAQAYLKMNGLLRAQPAFLPTSVWPTLLPWLLEDQTWQQLFQHVHPAVAYSEYQRRALCWLEQAAEIVATLEVEQQGTYPSDSTVAERAITVMTRWAGPHTDPSQGQHGAASKSHGESTSTPHTPVNKPINQSTNKSISHAAVPQEPRTHELTGRTRETGNWEIPREQADGCRDDRPTADAGANAQREQDGSSSGKQPSKVTGSEQQNTFQAEAETDQLARAEAALWAALPHVLQAVDAAAAHIQAVSPYAPTRSEQRQARRLLRNQTLDQVLAALRQTVASHRPAPGQPLHITRFGFAVGLPIFRVALHAAAVSVPSGPTVENDPASPLPLDAAASNPMDRRADFWQEYQRITGRRPTLAEQHRLEAVALRTDWSQLLIWLDRWERAHADDGALLKPGYFERCATSYGSEPRGSAAATLPFPEAELNTTQAPHWSADRQQIYERLAALRIKKARYLAYLPTTTLPLIDAWCAAAGEATVKNRGAYIAAGVGSGRYPDWPSPKGSEQASSSSATRSDSPTADAHLSGPVPSVGGRFTIAAALDPSSRQIWQTTLGLLEQQLSRDVLSTWIEPCTLLDLQSDQVILGAPNVFVRDEIVDQYLPSISEALSEVLGNRVEITAVIGGAGIHT